MKCKLRLLFLLTLNCTVIFQSFGGVCTSESLSVLAEKKPIEKTMVEQIEKFAPMLRAAPFNLHAAADYLESWVNGTLVQQPLLKVHGCSIPDSARPRPVMVASVLEPRQNRLRTLGASQGEYCSGPGLLEEVNGRCWG